LKPIFRYLVLKLPIRFQHNFNKILN
jgi:hypothetical protein